MRGRFGVFPTTFWERTNQQHPFYLVGRQAAPGQFRAREHQQVAWDTVCPITVDSANGKK
jgi:hypothetical protein